MKIGVVGEKFEQNPGIRADVRNLHRPDAGKRLKAVLVGVEQDATVADDRDRGEIGGAAGFGPGLRAVADVAGAKADAPHLIFPAGQQQRDREEHERAHPHPRPQRDVARWHRLRLSRTVRGGLPQARRQRAFTQPTHLSLVRLRMRNR